MVHFDLPLEELRSYRPEVREPADFDEFWDRTISQTRASGGALEIADEPAVSLPHVEVFDATFPGFDGHPIKAWYSRPTGVTEALPVVVEVAGYGGGRGLAIEHTFWPAAGYASFFMDTRGQGSGWGSGGDTPDPGGSGPAMPGSMTRGVHDPHEYYYRRVFADAVRAVDAARSLPGVDASRTVFKGGSQGGGIAIAVAGLVPDLAAVLPDVAFLCHFERAIQITDAFPYGEIVQYLSVQRDVTEQTLTTLSYFDGVNFAKRGTAPSLWSVALMDQTCPPSTTFAAFNWYGTREATGGRKEIEVYPYNGHEGGGGHQLARQVQFLAELLN